MQMKKIILILITLTVMISCSNKKKEQNNNPPKFKISLPKSYLKENNEVDKFNLLTASKFINEEIVSMIEIRYSDDWSFSEMTNDQLIKEMLNTNKIDSTATHMFNNFKVHSKQEIYLKGIGKCFGSVYSGDYYLNDVRVTNFTVQFIKDNKLFTLIGSSTPELFSGNYKEFLEIFDTFEI